MGWVVLIIIVVAVVFLLLMLVAMYNRLVRLRNRSENAWAQVDVQLKRRYDLIPNLVETVKGYAAHEKEVFEEVARRSQRGPTGAGCRATGAGGERPERSPRSALCRRGGLSPAPGH